MTTRHTRGISFGAILLLILSIGLLVGGATLNSCSFDQMRQMRELERVPQTECAAVVPGEVNLEGRAHAGIAGTILAPHSRQACLYYRYLVEQESRDSKGRRTWSTVSDTTNWVRPGFRITDISGAVNIQPHSNVRFSVRLTYQRQQGSLRYTEYRIDQGDQLFCFGYAVQDPDGLVVKFNEDGRYTPIISDAGEGSERRGMAASSVFECWGGLAMMSFAIVFTCFALGLHRIIVYLMLVTVIMGGGLVYYGLRMMNDDLHAAVERTEARREVVQSEFTRTMGKAAIAWDQTDLANVGSFDDDRFAALHESQRHRLQRIRIDLWRAIQRTNRLLGQFPEGALAPMFGVQPVIGFDLSPADSQLADELDQRFEPARLNSTLAKILVPAGLAFGVMLTVFGFRAVKTKRYIENIPTTPVEGAVWGPLEIVGTVEVEPGSEAFKGPLSHADCVQYHYLVQERRGSGKNASWVTIENKTRHRPFLCVEGDAALSVDPSGAKIYTSHKVNRRSGNRTYNETSLRPGDELYALGYSTAVPPDYKRLQLGKAPIRFPYILSNTGELSVMLAMSRNGQALLNFALCFVVLAGLILFGANGGFAASDYLLAALIAPAYLTLLFFLLLYNDMIFLRQRLSHTMSNIDVALKKRFDLLPNLEAVVKQYMSHESGLQTKLAEMRTANMHEAGAVVDSQFSAVIERYPELKAHESSAKLMKSLIRLENEIALMRASYNQAVERYNTRIASFPELLLAIVFRFRSADFYRASFEVHEVPKLGFEDPTPAPVEQDESNSEPTELPPAE